MAWEHNVIGSLIFPLVFFHGQGKPTVAKERKLGPQLCSR